jgi:hypothetical protein
MARRGEMQESISILSTGLIEGGLSLLQRDALPVYQINRDRRGPPFAHGENLPSAMALLLLSSGLDYHLARLKWLRDLTEHKPPLSVPTYFNWGIDDSLSIKVTKLLVRQREQKLCRGLIELTAARDSVAHPKLYVVKDLIKSDLSFGRSKAKLSGSTLSKKASQIKMNRSERTRLLRLPLVPTWISYPDAVLAVLVVSRFLNLLEEKYGSYAWAGGFSIRNEPVGFFQGWGETTRRSITIEEWVRAFYASLSMVDQQGIRKRLGNNLSPYISKRRPRLKIGKGTITDILRAMHRPRKLEFLRKPPPWKI